MSEMHEERFKINFSFFFFHSVVFPPPPLYVTKSCHAFRWLFPYFWWFYFFIGLLNARQERSNCFHVLGDIMCTHPRLECGSSPPSNLICQLPSGNFSKHEIIVPTALVKQRHAFYCGQERSQLIPSPLIPFHPPPLPLLCLIRPHRI